MRKNNNLHSGETVIATLLALAVTSVANLGIVKAIKDDSNMVQKAKGVLESMVKSAPTFLDEKKALQAELDYGVYLTAKSNNDNGEYILLKVISAEIRNDKFEGLVTIELPNGELAFGNYKTLLPEIILANGDKTSGQIIDRAIAVIRLKDGNLIPVKIINGRIRKGQLEGTFSGIAQDTGYQVAAFSDRRKISQDFVTVNPTYVSPLSRTLAHLAVVETKTFIDSGNVLAAEDPDGNSLGTIEENVLAVLGDERRVIDYEGKVIVKNYDTGTFQIAGVNEPTVGLDVIEEIISTSVARGAAPLTIVESEDIKDLTIQTIDLADNSVTSIKIADETITGADIKNDSIKNEDIANSAINANKIENETLSTSDFTSTLTFSAGDFIDLSAVNHSTSAQQGLLLPNVSSATPTSPSTGEGYLAYDTSGNTVLIYDGSSWTQIGGSITLYTGSGETTTTNSSSGMEVINTEELSLIRGCGANQLLKWDETNKLWQCASDNTGAGGASLDSLTAAVANSTTQDSNAFTLNWNWDFQVAGSDAGVNISESNVSIGGLQDQQALVRIGTIFSGTASTASPLQVTSNSGDVGDIFFNLAQSGDLEIRDAGVAFVTFDDTGGTTIAGNITANDAGADTILIGAAADTVTITSNLLSLTDDNWSIGTGGIITTAGNINANGGFDVDDAFVIADGGSVTTLSVGDTNIPLTGGDTTIDLNAAAPRILTITNSNVSNTASLSVEGTITASNLSGTSSGTNTGDQNVWYQITTPDAGNPTPDTTSDTLTLANGSGISITAVSGTDTITIAASLGTSIDTTEIDANTITLADVANSLTFDADLTLVSDSAVNDFKLVIDNSSAGDIATAMAITTTGVGGTYTTAIDLSDAGITNAISIGSANILTSGATISAAELNLLDSGVTLGELTDSGNLTASQNIDFSDAVAGDSILIGDSGDTVTITSNLLSLTDDNWSIGTGGAASFSTLTVGGTLDPYVDEAGDTMTGTLTFNAAAPDITTVTDLDLTITPSSSGDTVFALDSDTQLRANYTSTTTATYITGAYGAAATLGAGVSITGASIDLSTNLTFDAGGNALTGLLLTVGAGGAGTTTALSIAGAPDQGIVIGGAAIDITTGSNEDLDINANGIGDIFLYGDADSQVFVVNNGIATADRFVVQSFGSVTGGVDGTFIDFSQGDNLVATEINSALHVAASTSSNDADSLYGIYVESGTAASATPSQFGLIFDGDWDTDITTESGVDLTLSATSTGDIVLQLDTDTPLVFSQSAGGTDITTGTGESLVIVANGAGTVDIQDATTVDSLTADTGGILVPAAEGIDTSSAGALELGKLTATSLDVCNSAACDTVNIGNLATVDADTINIGDTLDTLVINSTGFTLTSGGNADFAGTLTAGTSNAFSVAATGVVTLAGAQAVDITTASAGTSNAIVIAPGDSTTVSGTGSSLTLRGSNQTGTTSTGGNLVLDAGSGTTAGGSVTIGNTNAASVSVCNSANCDTITIGTNADADTITIADSLDTVTFNANVNADAGLDVDNAFVVADGGNVSSITISDATVSFTGSTTFDLATAATTTLTLNNSNGINTALLVVDSATADPGAGGTAGSIYYNTTSNVFKCFTTTWVNCDTGGGGGAWDTIGDPSVGAAINFGETAQTMDWTLTTANSDYFSFTFTNNGGTAGTDRGVVIKNAASSNSTGDVTTEALLVLDQADTNPTADNALTDGLLITNSGGSTFTNAITIGSGTQAIGTALNISSTGVTTDIKLQNAETIDNNANGSIVFTGVGGTNNNALTIDLEASTYPILHSGTDSILGIDEDLTFIGAQTINTTTGDLIVASNGTSTGSIRIGSSSASGTPDLLVLDQKNTASDPAGVLGALYVNNSGKFMVYEGGTPAWKEVCNKIDQGCGTGTGSAWSALGVPITDLTLAMDADRTTFNWTSTVALDAWTMTMSNNSSSATTQNLATLSNSIVGSFTDATTENLLLLQQLDTVDVGTTVVESGLHVDSSGTSGMTNGVQVSATSGTIANGILIADGAGAITDGIEFTGAFTTNLINAPNFDVNNAGNITVAAAEGLDTNGAGVLELGKANATSVDICNSANCDTIDIGNLATVDADTINIGDTLDTLVINSTGFTLTSGGNADFAGTLTAGTSNAFSVAATGDITTVTNETINGIDISAGAISDVVDLDVALLAANTATISKTGADAGDVLALTSSSINSIDGFDISLTSTADTLADTYQAINIAWTESTDTLDTFTAINLPNTTSTNSTTQGLVIGTGYDTGISVASGGVTITAGALAVNTSSGITSNQATLIIDAGGTVDIRDAATVDSLTADTGGILVPAAEGIDTSTGGALELGKLTATSLDVCNSAACDTVNIGNLATVDADSILIGDSSDTVTITSNLLSLTDDNWSIGTGGAASFSTLTVGGTLDPYVDEAGDTMTGTLTFNAAAPDITTETDLNLTITPSLSGDTIFSLDTDTQLKANYTAISATTTYITGAYGAAATLGAGVSITGASIDLSTNLTFDAGGNALTGLLLTVGAGGAGTTTAVDIEGTPDVDIDLQNDERITNSSDGTIQLAANTGAVTVSLSGSSATISNTTSDLTINSANNLVLADTTVQFSGGSTTFDLTAAATTTLTLNNSNGTNTALLVVDSATADPGAGGTAGSIYYNTTSNVFKCFTTTWVNCDTTGGSSTLQDAYNNDAGAPATITMTAADGSIVFEDIAATQFQVTMAASTAPTIDMMNILNTGASQGTTTTGVDGLQVDFATAAVVGSVTNAGIQVNLNTAGATEAGDTVYGVNIANITAQTGSEYALNIGTGWDRALNTRQGANGNTMFYGLRFTDTTPTGNFILFRNAADNTDLFKVDVAGNITVTSCTGCGGGGTTWNTIGDATADGAIAFVSTVQTMDWGVMDANASFFSFNFTNAGTVAGTDSGVVINNALNNVASTDNDTENLLLIQQLDDATGSSITVDNAIKIDAAAASPLVDGIEITNSGAGSAITNAINIADSTGTIATGILMSGTFTSLIDAPSFDVNNAGTVTIATGQAYTGTGTVTLSSAAASALNISPGTTGDVVVTHPDGSQTQFNSTNTTDNTLNIVDINQTNTAATSANVLNLLAVRNLNEAGTTGTPDSLIYATNLDANETVADGLKIEMATAGATLTNGIEITHSAGTLTNAIDLTLNAISTGKGINITSNSTALTTGNFFALDWSPTTTTASGDLVSINIGASGTTTGNLFNIKDAGSPIFSVSEIAFTTSLPSSFTSSGDVSVAYDLVFTNQTASFIKTNAPFAIEAGESFENNNLTLRTFGAGNIVMDFSGAGDAIFTHLDGSQTQFNSTNTADNTINIVDINQSNTAGASTGTLNLLAVRNLNEAGTTGTPDSLIYATNLDANETVTNGLFVEMATAGGTLSSGIQITQSAGTLTTGIAMTGTFTNLIDTPTFDVSNAGTVTIASAQSYTGAGAVTLSSGGTNTDVTIDAIGTGKTVLADTTVNFSGGSTTFDLTAAATTTLTLNNSNGTNTALLVVDSATANPGAGGTAGSIYYNTTSNVFRCFTTTWVDCDTTGGSTSLQSAYNNGATIETDNTNPILFTETGADVSHTTDILQLTANPATLGVFSADVLQLTMNAVDTGAFTGNGLRVIVNQTATAATAYPVLVETSGAAPLFRVDENGAMTIAGAQAADITTLAGTAPTAITIQPGNNTTVSGTGAALTLKAGDESGTTSTGGSVTINAGDGTSTDGNINIGTATTTAISLGNATNNTTLTLTGTGLTTLGGSLTVSGASITASSATTVTLGANVSIESAGNITLNPTSTVIIAAADSFQTDDVTSVGALSLVSAAASAINVQPGTTGDLVITHPDGSQTQFNSTNTADNTINIVDINQSNTAGASTGTLNLLAVRNLNEAGTTGTPDSLIYATNLDANETVTNGLFVEMATAGGTITNGLQLTQSAGTFGTGINFTGTFTNLISAPNFSVNNAGALTSVGVNSGTGLIQGTGGLQVSGAAISLNVSSNFATSINTGTSTGTVTIGGGSAPLIIDSTTFDVNAGAVSGVTTLSLSGDITWSATTPAITINNGEVMTIADAATPDTFTINTTTHLFSLSDGTNSFTMDIDAGTGLVYANAARPTNKMVLSAEYPGASLFADGTTNTGSMTSDYTNSQTTGSRNTYYEWNSTTASPLQDYAIIVRFTIPDDFDAWDTNPIVFDFVTELTTSADNQIDISVFAEGDATADATDLDNVSAVAATWTTTQDITAASLTTCTGAGVTCVIEIYMQSQNNNYARIGDITLNYKARR